MSASSFARWTCGFSSSTLSSQCSDAFEEVGDAVDSHEDQFILRQLQQALNERPPKGAQDDIDVNFWHKKKKVFRPPQVDGRVSLEKDICISSFLVISSAFISLAFVSNILLCLL